MLEIELPAPLDWAPEARVVVAYDAGRLASATVDATRSTHPGPVEAGQVVRLAIELDDEPGANEPREILLESAGFGLRLRIGA